MDTMILIITIALIAIVSAIILFFAFGKGKGTPQIYIVGCTGSGKTKLFYYLTTNHEFSTLTSQSRNTFHFDKNGKKGDFIDLPGHPRIRTEVMSSIKNATAIIFTIDSETALQKMSDIGNFLYDILIEEQIYKRKVPILITATKIDTPNSRPIDLIQSELERELEFIRKNRQQSTYVEHNEASTLFIGNEDSEFTFSQLVNPVDFATCSITAENVKEVSDFIDKMLV